MTPLKKVHSLNNQTSPETSNGNICHQFCLVSKNHLATLIILTAAAMKLSSTLRFFLKHRGSVDLRQTVRQETYHSSNLEQVGVQVPVVVLCSISLQLQL